MGDASIPTPLHTAPAPTRLEASANYDILRTCSSIDLFCRQQYAIVIVGVFNEHEISRFVL